MVTTYILAGFDHNGAFQDVIPPWEKRAADQGDVVVLHPEPDETMEHLAKRIKTPCNIVLEAHGGEDGSFAWSKASSHYYKDLFKELPRDGIQSITVDGCHGESSIAMLESVPAGTLLQARNGTKVGNWGGAGTRMSKEITSYATITPLSIMLEALDNTNPAVAKKWDDATNKIIQDNPEAAKKYGLHADNFSPDDVLAHTIGIGGTPPIKVDLNQKMAELSKNGYSSISGFKKAIQDVKDHFDPNNGDIEIRGDVADEWIGDKTGFYFGKKKKLDAQIDEVVKKIQSGADTSKFTIEEKRIGYALTIANLYESGEMSQLIAQGKEGPPVHHHPVQSYGTDLLKKAQETAHNVVQHVTDVFHKATPHHTTVEWTGQGNETTAKIQAIAEVAFHQATDRGGANDHRVDGLEGTLTQAAIEKLEDKYHLSHTSTQADLLKVLLHDPQVIAAFGKANITGGEYVADVTLSSSAGASRSNSHHNSR